jgi:UTP--glucose-1-phosphate uridylyltransferase
VRLASRPVSEDGLRASIDKMREEGVPDAAIRAFEHYYKQLEAGETGLMPERSIEPVTDLPALDDLPHDPDAEQEALQHAIVLRLNGGLGTSMGLTAAKSLLEVKDGLSFLDVIARQVLSVRRDRDVHLPLVLMDSFSTRDDSLAALARYAELRSDVAVDFVQNKEPKIRIDDLMPVEWPPDPALEWCPPGHGDLYTALVTSGMLADLLERGYEYAFVANSDNLGAVLDGRILAWLSANRIPFLMEVTDRTEADRKGGHLARRREDGRLVLRETAQTPEEDLEALQDIATHRYVNTNNLWVDLRALDTAMRERDGVLGLPMIRNEKTVDPTDKSSPAVYQLETAMGAAIQVFEGARALRVPRTRFAPVKTTDDLLALRSDAYELTDDARMVLATERDGRVPYVALDSDYFKLLRDFEARFPGGPPSLVDCDRFVVEGDVRFGAGVVVRGDVTVRQEGEGQRTIEDGTVLDDSDVRRDGPAPSRR